jgi:hypothetical protein
MSERQTTELTVGPYRFTIVDTTNYYQGRVVERTFKMGGTYPDCVNISISYDGQSQPVGASIPYVVADPECSRGTPLDRGAGSVMMLKALLRHIHEKIPRITQFFFDDKSNIECGTEEEKRSRRHPKKGSYARPVPLNYFSIAFNGYTWYEKNFHAMYKNEEEHAEYRARIGAFLTEEKMPPFDDFLRSIPGNGVLLANKDMLEEVKALYEGANTYKDFFTSIPKEKRCPHARVWLISFITKKLSGVFSNNHWFIDVTRMDEPVVGGGSRGKGRRGQGERRTRKRGDSYYVPRRVRRDGGGEDGHMIGIDPIHV